MTPDAITLGEVVRRLDEIVRRLDKMASDAAEREKLFVRTDIYSADKNIDAVLLRGLESQVHMTGKRLDEVERERREVEKEEVRFRKQIRLAVVGAFVGPLCILLLSAVLEARGLA